MFQSISILFISRKYFYNKCNVNENLKDLKLKRKEKNRKIDIQDIIRNICNRSPSRYSIFLQSTMNERDVKYVQTDWNGRLIDQWEQAIVNQQ